MVPVDKLSVLSSKAYFLWIHCYQGHSKIITNQLHTVVMDTVHLQMGHIIYIIAHTIRRKGSMGTLCLVAVSR